MEVSLGKPGQNLRRARRMLQKAKARGAELVVLPELWSTGYVLERAGQYGCSPNVGVFEEISSLAREFKLYLCGSIIEASDASFFNTQTIYSPEGTLLASYRKIHLFGLMHEPEFLTAGGKLVTVALPWGKAGLAICYDLRFPEMFRSYALSGVQLFLISAEWPRPRLDHWRTLLRARAVENQCFLVACNCVGEGNGNIFGGHSMIVDPWGEVLAEGKESEMVISADLNLEEVNDIRSHYPVLADVRPELINHPGRDWSRDLCMTSAPQNLSIRIGNRLVGPQEPVFIVAEAGVNHNGDLETARRLVEVAAVAGADAVKFQTFRAEAVASPNAPKARYQLEATDRAETQLEMLRRLELSPQAHRELKEHCRKNGIIFLSTPFDEEAADLLEELEVPAFKISSGDVTNLPLLEHVARKGKPVILSTGMSDIEEVGQAVQAIRKAGCKDLVLLQCVSNYPANPADVNLRAMHTLAIEFSVPVGYSDHTEGIEAALAAVAVGACIIEKHFTLDRNLPGPDHQASLGPGELASMIAGIRKVEAALGDGRKVRVASEADTARAARRSLTAARDISAGTRLTRGMIAVQRPGTGLSPAMLSSLVGRRVRVDVPAGSLFSLEMLD